MNIRMKFTLAALVAALVPLGGYFTLSYSESQKQVDALVKAGFEESTAIGTQRLDDWFFTNQAALRVLAKVPALMTGDPAEAQIELKNHVKPYPWVRAAFATDASGMQIVRSDDEKPVPVGDRAYYKEAKAKGFGRDVIVSRVTNKPSLIMAATMSAETGSNGGAAAFALDLDSISKAVVSLSAADQAKVTAGQAATAEQRFIALESGKLLAHSKPSVVAVPKVGDLSDITKHPLWASRPKAGEMSLVHYADASGKQWVGAMKQSNLGWYVAVEVPEEEVNEPLVRMKERSLVAIGIAAVLASLVAFVAGGFLARPIRTLTSVTESIAAGKFDDERLAAINSKDEIGALAKSIQRLSNSVKIEMEMLARKK